MILTSVELLSEIVYVIYNKMSKLGKKIGPKQTQTCLQYQVSRVAYTAHSNES